MFLVETIHGRQDKDRNRLPTVYDQFTVRPPFLVIRQSIGAITPFDREVKHY